MMPLAPTAPGVYVREESSGVRTITGVSVSITAFLGRALRGPVNRPVIVNSFGEFERMFGGLWAGAALGYAVRSFFLNGGGQAVVVRLHKPTTAGDGLASLTIGGVRLDAVEPGAWGNGISATLDSDGITDDVAQRYGLGVADLFNLSVTGAGVVERFVNLTVADNARRIDRVLAQQSRLVSAPVSGLPTTSPSGAATEQASGGDDGGSLGADEFIGSQAAKTGLYALDLTDIVNLLVIPPDTVDADVPTAVYQAAISYAASRRAVVLVDPPAAWDPIGGDPSALLGLFAGPDSRNAALFFPRVLQSDPIRGAATGAFVPGGAIAGVIARTDAQRGIWKAPAGVDATISGVTGLAVNLTDAENGRLNPLGINSLRSFPVAGVVVWGARTLRVRVPLAPWSCGSPAALSSRIETVECVEDDGTLLDAILILGAHPGSSCDEVLHASHLLAAELGLLEIDVVNDVRHGAQRRVVDRESAQHHLEPAKVAVVGELGVEHIEAKLSHGRSVAAGRDELERGLRIDEATDEPGARDAVDVDSLARDPGSLLHVGDSELKPGHRNPVGVALR